MRISDLFKIRLEVIPVEENNEEKGRSNDGKVSLPEAVEPKSRLLGHPLSRLKKALLKIHPIVLRDKFKKLYRKLGLTNSLLLILVFVVFLGFFGKPLSRTLSDLRYSVASFLYNKDFVEAKEAVFICSKEEWRIDKEGLEGCLREKGVSQCKWKDCFVERLSSMWEGEECWDLFAKRITVKEEETASMTEEWVKVLGIVISKKELDTVETVEPKGKGKCEFVRIQPFESSWSKPTKWLR